MKNALLACMVLLSLASWAQEDQLVDKIVATVGDEIILYSDIQTQKAQMLQQGFTESENLDCDVAEELLMQNLLLNQAKIDSLEVSEDEIQQTLERRLAYFISLVGSIEQFESYYGKTTAQYKAEFYDDIKDQLLSQKMQDKINGDANVTPTEVREYFETIPKDSLPLINETVSYSKIVVRPEIDKVAKDRERLFLDSLRTLVATGKTSMFTAAALHSEDPGSKYKGGCYDNIRKGQFDPAYEAAVFTTAVGDFSPVFESSFGYHFVQVKEVRGETYSTCHVLRIPKIDENELDYSKIKIDSIYNVLTTDSIDFSILAQRHSTDEESANGGGVVIDPQTGDTRQEVRNLDPKLFFVLNNLEVDAVSEPALVEGQDGNQQYVIYKLTKRLPAHVANLKDDYQLIQTAAQGDKRNKSLEKWVQKKLSVTYVSLDEEISGCTFEYLWQDVEN